MDQHPIPQDVTGFQFKLIGTMTVKQFGYVATGVVLAVVLYYMPLKGFFGILAKVVLIPLFGGSGALIAFVPIEGRPIDVMATNFFKAIFSPNQYVYRKSGRKFSFSMVNTASVTTAATAAAAEEAKKKTPATVKQKAVSEKEAQLQAFLESSHSESQSALDKKEQAMLSSLALPKAPPPALTPRPALHTTGIATHPATAVAKPAVTAHPATPVHTAPAVKPLTTAAHPAPAVTTPKPVPAVMPAPAAAGEPSPAPQQEATLAQQETQLQQQLQTAKQEETTTHAPAAHQKVLTLEKQLQEVHAQKLILERELQSLKDQLNATPQAKPASVLHAGTGGAAMTGPANQPASPTQLSGAPVPVIPKAEAPAIPATQYANTIGQAAAPTKGDLPHVSDTPNVVVGIVKDPRGNILPNMLVEVKDKDGNPVRAFKTNALGQFASATPLAPGMYTIELDDPKKQHSFDVIQITASNQIMMPIEVVSHDAREELRKQLFN